MFFNKLPKGVYSSTNPLIYFHFKPKRNSHIIITVSSFACRYHNGTIIQKHSALPEYPRILPR